MRMKCLRWLNRVLPRSAATRVTARVLIRQQTWRRKSNGTQKATSQNLLIKILRHLAEVLLPSYFKQREL